FVSSFRAHNTPQRADETKILLVTGSTKQRRLFWLAVFFVTLTISGHLGLGVMTLLSIGIIALSPVFIHLLKQESISVLFNSAKDQLIKLALISGTSLFFLSYFAIPALINDKYHNLSFWDPVWKFNSW